MTSPAGCFAILLVFVVLMCCSPPTVQYDIPIQLGSFLLTIAVILNIPLNTHPLRITFDWMLFGPQSRIPEDLRYYSEIFLMVFSALVIAIFVPSITVVSLRPFATASLALAHQNAFCSTDLFHRHTHHTTGVQSAWGHRNIILLLHHAQPALSPNRPAPLVSLQGWPFPPGSIYSRACRLPPPGSRTRQGWAALVLLVTGTASGITSTVIIIMDLVKDI